MASWVTEHMGFKILFARHLSELILKPVELFFHILFIHGLSWIELVVYMGIAMKGYSMTFSKNTVYNGT
jgi:hypothetical protein